MQTLNTSKRTHERKSKTWTLQSKNKKLPKTWYKALLQYHAATAAALPKWPDDGKLDLS